MKGRASKSEPSKKEPAKPEKEGEGKKLVINNFILRQGKVNLAVSTALGGNAITADLPDIHLKDIGKEKGGATPEEVFEKVFAALHKQITSAAVTDMLNKELKAMGTSLDALSGTATKQLESIKAGDKEAIKSATDKVKGLFGK